MKGVFRTEVDNAVVEVENLVREKGIVYRDEIDRLCKHLGKKSRKQVFFLLGKKRHLRRVEDMFQYDEKEGKTEVEESEIFSSLMKPEFVNTERDCVQVGNTFFRGLCCTGFPAEVDNNWLSRLASEKGNADFGIFITPSSIAASEIYLNAELKRVNFDLYRYQEQNIPNPSLEERKRELEQSLRALVSGEYKHFKVALFLIAKGVSREKAASLSKKVSSSLSGDGIESEYATFYQEPLFKSIVPLGVNHLKGRENIVPGDGLAASFPFSFPWLDIDEEDGILLGWNDNGLPIARSMWKEPSYSGVFVGPTGSGKSVRGNEMVLLKEKGRMRLVKIGEYVDELLSVRGTNFTDKKLEGVTNPGVEVYSFDEKTLQCRWSKVLLAGRQPSDRICYCVRTRSGRQIRATGDHNFVVLDKYGSIINVRGDELKAGCFVPLPRKIDFASKSVACLNLFELLKSCDGVYVIDGNRIIDENYDSILNARPINKAYDKFLRFYRKGRKIPLKYYCEVLGKIGKKLSSEELGRIRLSSNLGLGCLPAVLNVTPELMRLMGYVIAEGTIVEARKTILISNTNVQVLDDIRECYKSLGLTCYDTARKDCIICANRIFYHLIKAVDIGADSATKKIPQFVYSANEKLLKEFLKALFEGDGSVPSEATPVIEYCTKSKELADGLSYLLLRFGILTRSGVGWKRAVNTAHKGAYYCRLYIYGVNIQEFYHKIGFVSPTKNSKLEAVVSKKVKRNPNFDLIPCAREIVIQIDKILNTEKRSKAVYDGLWNDFSYSRRFTKKTVKEIGKWLRQIQSAKKFIHSLETMPTIEELIRDGLQKGGLWRTAHTPWYCLRKYGENSRTSTVFKLHGLVYGSEPDFKQIRKGMLNAFETLGIGVRQFSQSLTHNLLQDFRSLKYEIFEDAIVFLKKKYADIDIKKVESLLQRLKWLADSGLFWDEVKSVTTEKCKDEYVYDLTVEDGNFLCGTNGLFIHNSYAAKTFIHLESMVRGTRIIIVDPAATKGAAPEYKRMCREKDGSYISFSTKSKNIPNILSLYGDSYEDAMFDVESLLSVLLGGENGAVSDAQKPILEKALVRTYEKAGVTEDVKTWENPPTLDMLYSTLQQDMRSVRSEQTRMSYEALINRLSRFVGRGLYKFINQRKSELNVDNPFTVFEFKDTPNEIKPVLTGIVMNYIKEKALGNTDKTLIVLEEAHLWLSNPVLAEFIGKLVVLLRKSNTGIILIFQGVSQLQNCEQGVTVLGNLMFTYILGCKKAEMPLTAKAFGLNDIEQELILNSKQGSGVLIWNKKHFTVNIRINKEMHRLVTTHPEEVKAIEVEETQKTPVDDESMESLKEDLGYVPQTLEEGAKALAKDIASGNTDEGIINHYHEPCASLVRKHLADLRRKGVVPADKLTKAQDDELEKLAKRIEQRLISKASKTKKGENKRKKLAVKKKARRS